MRKRTRLDAIQRRSAASNDSPSAPVPSVGPSVASVAATQGVASATGCASSSQGASSSVSCASVSHSGIPSTGSAGARGALPEKGSNTKRSRMDSVPRGKVGPRLLKRIGQGTLASSEAQAFADDIVHDYGDHGDLVSGIATLGRHGQYPQNCQRDLFNWSRTRRLKLEPAFVACTVKNLRDHGTCIVPHAVLYPHETFAAVATQLPPKAFEDIFVGPAGTEGLSTFWDQDVEWIRRHPGSYNNSNNNKRMSYS